MLETNDILETISMISEEKLDIRTVTMGISLYDCVSDDIGRLENNIYDKINGVFFSRLHLDVLPCKIEEEPFIEVCSLLGGETNKNFFIDEEFLLTPPEYVSVVDLKGGYLLRFNKKNDSGEFKKYKQQWKNVLEG